MPTLPQNAGNRVSEDKNFQNFPGEDAPALPLIEPPVVKTWIRPRNLSCSYYSADTLEISRVRVKLDGKNIESFHVIYDDVQDMINLNQKLMLSLNVQRRIDLNQKLMLSLNVQQSYWFGTFA